VTSFRDLGELTAGLRSQLFDFSYLPVANLFFLRDAPFRGLASAVSPRTSLACQSSVLIVGKESPVTDWRQLQGKRLGYINTYCTTSYFAPAILVAREGLALTSFFDAFPVAPWQGQVDAVVDGQIDATMVFEDVWLATPQNADRTKIIARMDDLPTPAVVAASDLDTGVSARLQNTLLGLPRDGSAHVLYAGFAAYEEGLTQRFFKELSALPGLASAA
jgi:phosphonate transport system substrate-binding protein